MKLFNLICKRASCCALLLALTAITATSLQAERTVITRADDLPRIAYPFSGNALELFNDADALGGFIEKAEAEIQSQLERFIIKDRATMRGYLNALRIFAVLDGRDAQALDLIQQVRELEEKPSERLTSGLISEALLRARQADPGAQPQQLAERFHEIFRAMVFALPWSVVQDEIKSTNGLYQFISETLLLGSIETALQNRIDQSGQLRLGDVSSLASTRVTLDHIFPLREIIVAVTGEFIAEFDEIRPDIWAERDIDLTGRTNLTPVIIAISDSGIDAEVFLPHGQMWINPNEVIDGTDSDGNGFIDDLHGIAHDLDSRRTTGNLFPLTEEQMRLYPEMLDLTKGLIDLQNAVNSEEAARTRGRMANLPREEFQPFVEMLNLIGNFTHGTHVAGIAAAGNPAARLMNARITFGHTLIPDAPTIAEAVRGARAIQDSVDYFRSAGVRIVNMSWGGNQSGLEYALQANGIGDTAEERAEIARVLFNISYDALVEAMRSAPEILFIPAAGNSDSDVDFHRVIPSSIDLPNVLVVGAVDQAGEETSFTSYGRNIRAHANGFNVESHVPGGRRMAFSGTSMSAPNVANLAGKLLAVDPSLSPTEVISLIQLGMDVSPDGRRFLIHPRRSMAILEARLSEH